MHEICGFALALGVAAALGQPSLVDPAFNVASGANDDVFAVARDASGGFVVGGQFTSFEGLSRGRLARLNANGSSDTVFFNGIGANGNIYAIAIQGDGKILIGGSFTQVHGQNRTYVARLESDGSLDATFTPPVINNELRAITLEPDGRILIAGRFTLLDGQEHNRIARLQPAGAIDPAFQSGSGANDNIRTMLRQTDGRILIGGQFTIYNGASRPRMARLLNSGAIDSTFNPILGADGQVRAIATNSLGEIYIGGDFSQYNTAARPGIARLFPGGSVDPGFNPPHPIGSAVRAIAVAEDGSVWVGGAFSVPGNFPRLNLTRLLTNGLPDGTFNPFPLVNDEVFSIVPDGPDRMVIAGDFRLVDNRARSRVARLIQRSTEVTYDFVPTITEAAENTATATLVIQRFGDIANSSIVELRVTGGTAIAGEDFVAPTALLTFAPMETSLTVSISLLDDATPEGNEWFSVDLVDPPGGPFDPLDPSHLVTILDNEYQATVDEEFVPDSINGAVLATAPQPDGSVMIGGEFTYFGSCLENSITRLRADGRVDCDFNAYSTGTDGPVLTISVQTNGYIVAGGLFTYFNSQPANFLVRLQPDGFSDAGFLTGTWLNGAVLATAIQPDGRILVGGRFTSHGAVAQPYLLRLQTNGALDTSFRPAVNGFVRVIRLTGENRLFIGGDFTLVNEIGRSKLARLNTDGSLDSTYLPGPGPDGSVMAVAELSDGRLMIAGEFSRVDNQPRSCLARLSATGALDPTFNAGSLGGSPRVNAVAVHSDGKVVFGGLFGSVGGFPRPFLARVLDTGVLDTGFPSSGANGPVHSLHVLTNQQVLVAGNFTEVASAARRYVARLNPEPTVARLEFVAGATNLFESAGPVRLTVRRVGSSALEASVSFSTIAGTATPGSDFQTIASTLTFAPLETVKNITIPLLNDGLPEPSETFRVRLENPTGEAVLGSLIEAVVTVLDNDAGLEFALASVALREGDANATLVVTRNSDGPAPVTVDYATVDGSAVAGSDFVASTGTLTFLANDTEKSIVIPLQNNPEFEGRESFLVRLSNPSPGIVLGTNSESTVFIEDQDSSFRFSIINFSTEGEWPRALCYVHRVGLLTQTATVRLRTDGGTATAGLDYTPIDRVLTFNPGEFLQEFYVTSSNDGLVEGSEFVRLTLSEPTGLAIIGDPGEAFTEIYDNDRGIEFIAPEFYVNEFTSIVPITVRRGDDGSGALTVRYTVVAESATIGADFIAQAGVLTLAPGETNAPIEIPILQDRVLEPRETFRIELSQPGPNATVGTQGVARVVILDDERAGSLDVTFRVNPDDLSPWGNYSPVSISPHSGGSIIVGASRGLSRLDRSGRNDTNFVANTQVNFFTPVTLPRPDGKILVGGSSSNDFVGAGNSCLRLLQTNGALDASFNFPINQGRTAVIALHDDGRIVLGGDFSGTTNGFASVLRVLPSGALDPEFRIARFSQFQGHFIGPSTVEAIEIQPNSNILAAGTFTSVDTLPRDLIVRFLPNGAVDPSFQGPAVLPPVGVWPSYPQEPAALTSLALQADGRVFIGGSFTNLGGAPAHNLARLHATGALDTSFVAPFASDQVIRALALQPDGRLIVAGSSREAFAYRSFVCRLLPNGDYDPDFEITRPNGSITDLVLLPGGDISVGGVFTAIDGIERPLVARLKGDGLVLHAETAGLTGTRLQLFNTWPGGVTILDASANLFDWLPIRTNIATRSSQEWIEPKDGPRRFYRASHREP